MKTIQNTIRSASIFALILCLMISSFSQSTCAAMIGTEALLEPERRQETRQYLRSLIAREQVQEMFVNQGINTQEARARIESLTDDEIDQIADQIAKLPAGGDAWGFVLIVGAVILILILVVEYNSEVKMFPWLPFGD